MNQIHHARPVFIASVRSQTRVFFGSAIFARSIRNRRTVTDVGAVDNYNNSDHHRYQLHQVRRRFSTHHFTGDERGSYDPERGAYVAEHKAVMYEGDWVCACPLGMRLSEATRQILTKAGWASHEIERDCAELKAFRTTGAGEMSVAQFQVLPWYERFSMKADVDQSTIGCYFTQEAMKLLEKNLVPPSRRGDPYHHLRRREMEDDFRLYDEGPGRSENCTRRNMSTAAGKNLKYAQPSLAQYNAFRKEYVKRNGPTDDEVLYREWFTTFGYSAELLEPRSIKW